MIGRDRERTPLCVAIATALLLVTSTAFGQAEDRGKLWVNNQAERLVIRSLGPENTDLGLELRIVPLTGSELLIATDGQDVSTTLGTMDLVGFGSSPDINDSGLTVFHGAYDDPDSVDDGDDPFGSAIWRATRAGALTRVVEARGGEAGTPISGGTVCSLDPMPSINNNGDVMFGYRSDLIGDADNDGAGSDTANTQWTFGQCGNSDGEYDWNDTYATRLGSEMLTGIARWTPSTITKLVQTGDTITVGTPFRPSNTTFTLTAVMPRRNGSQHFNNLGHAVVESYADNDFTVSQTDGTEDPDGVGALTRDFEDDITVFVYVKGGNASDRLLVAATGAPGTSIYQEILHPTINDSGQVLFAGMERTGSTQAGYEDGAGTEQNSALVLWSEADGREEIADTKASTGSIPSNPPGSTARFRGFPPFYMINDAGQVAFTAGLVIAGVPTTNNNDVPGGDDQDYMALMLRDADGSLTEIARTTAADTAEGGGFESSAEGFPFDTLIASAILTETGNVFFGAETYDSIADNPCTPAVNDPWDPDIDGELSAIVMWTPSGGLDVILREGAFYPGTNDRIMSITMTTPQLREHTDENRRIFVKMVLDTDNDCVPGDPDDTIGVGVAGAPVAPTALPAEIPTLSTWSMMLFGALLAAAALAMLRIAA